MVVTSEFRGSRDRGRDRGGRSDRGEEEDVRGRREGTGREGRKGRRREGQGEGNLPHGHF